MASPVAVSVAPVVGSAPLPHCCALCGKTKSELAAGEKLRSCSGCGAARYCSSECQKAAWPGHKKECSGVAGAGASAVSLAEEGGEGQEQEVCTICFDSPPTAQLCHADGQSCQCCCGDCGDRLKAEDRPCPMCRKEIVLVVKQSFKYSVTAMT